MILSDAQAKAILEDKGKWPGRTNAWPIPGYKGYWIKACPHPAKRPFLHSPGATILKTWPDGMYLYVHIPSGFADVIAIEVCCNNQNFNDKRSRYTPVSGNIHITLPHEWLDSPTTVQKGGQRKTWEASGWFEHKPSADITLSIRHLRTLFVLTDEDYRAFGNNHLPAGHEYFCRHRDLGQINHQDMQAFIKGMALMKHFKVRP